MNRKVAVHRVNTEAVYFVGSGPDLVALAVEAKGRKGTPLRTSPFIPGVSRFMIRAVEVVSNHSR